MKSPERAKALLPVLLAALFWGTTYPTVRFGLTNLDLTPFSFLFLRFVFALLALFPLLFVKLIRKEVFWSLAKPDFLLLGIFNGLSYSLQFAGQVSTTAGIAAVMVNTYVLFTPLFSHLIFGQTIRRKKKIAVCVGFIGVVIIAMGDVLTVRTGSLNLTGTLLVLGGGLFAGLYVSYSEKVMNIKLDGKPLNSIAVFFSSTVFSFIVIFLTCLFFRDLPELRHIYPASLIPIAYLGVVCTSGAFILYLIAVRKLGAVDSAVFTLLQIIISMIIAFIFLNEVPDIFMFMGAPLVFLAVFLV